MKLPVQVSFRNMEKSQWIEDLILEKASSLDRFYGRIISCRVVVEIPHKRHHQGNPYLVRVDVSVPDKEIVVNRLTDENKEHQDMHATITDAFECVKRQVEEYGRKRRGQVKISQSAPKAKVIRIFTAEQYGFLETTDGREVYFHANSVLNSDFKNLCLGSEVAFAEEEGEEGPQASTVRMAG